MIDTIFRKEKFVQVRIWETRTHEMMVSFMENSDTIQTVLAAKMVKNQDSVNVLRINIKVSMQIYISIWVFFQKIIDVRVKFSYFRNQLMILTMGWQVDSLVEKKQEPGML